MIYDHLDNIAQYRNLSPRFATAIDWLTATDLDALTYHTPKNCGENKVQLDGDDVFALLQTYTPSGPEKCTWESHRQYADIQVVVSGREQMGIAALRDDPPVKQAYKAEIDAALYNLPTPASDSATSGGSRIPYAFLPFSAGTFAIYLPQDLHAPLQAIPGQTGPVRKIVVKVRVAPS